jgi:hypothetical protein
MADADRVREIKLRCEGRDIAAETSPTIGRRRLTAVAVPPSVNSIAMPARKVLDHLIPATRMEPGGMAKENRRILPGPFPEGDLESIDFKPMFNGHV